MSDDMKRELDGIKAEIRRGFSDMGKRLNDHDKRFEGVDKRFDSMDRRFDRLETTVRNIAVEQVRMRGDIEDIKENMVTKSEFRKTMSHLEAFASQMEAFRRQSIITSDILLAHHDRIVRLESRSA